MFKSLLILLVLCSTCYAVDRSPGYYGSLRNGQSVRYYSANGTYGGRTVNNGGNFYHYNARSTYMGRSVPGSNSTYMRHYNSSGAYKGMSRSK